MNVREFSSLTEHEGSLPFLQFFVLFSQLPYNTLFLKTHLNIIILLNLPNGH